MASRSMYIPNNHSKTNKSVETSYNNESLFMNVEDYNSNIHNSWLNSFVRSFDTSRIHPFNSSWIDFKDNSVNSIHQLFTFIDLSHFLILCIKRENEIITNMATSNYKSAINYHKIKEIDFIKLLVIIRDRIDSLAENVHLNDLCFSKEVSNRLEELDEILEHCFFSQINDVDVTDNFNLSSLMVDAILNDCNVDLLDLDTNILQIHQEWEKKQKRTRLSKNRIGRLSEKIADSLQNDVNKHLQTIGITLDRLLNGYSNTIFNVSHCELTKEFLLEFHIEVDGTQYQNIVYLKHFQLELEQKTLGLILELKETQIMSNFYDQKSSDNTTEFICELSPIKSTTPLHHTPVVRNKPPLLASTPSLACNSHSICPDANDYEDLISEGYEPSVLSLDSGILPISDHTSSSSTSIDTLDVLHISEKTNGVEEYDCEKRVTDEDSDCFGSMSICSENDRYTSISAICSSINITSSEKNGLLSSKSENEKIGFLDGIKGFENYDSVIEYLQIPMKQREELRNKIIKLSLNQEANSKFNCALSVTIFHSRNNPFDDLTVALAHLEEMFFDFVRTDISEMSFNHNWNSNLDIQNNNSACSPNFVSTFVSDFNNQNDQNTNNNADSKEDELSDHTASDDELMNNLSIYANNGHQLAFTISDSISTDLNNDQVNGNVDNINSDTVKDNANKVCTSIEANWQRYDELMVSRSGDQRKNGSLFLEDIDLALKLSELHIRSEFESEHCNDNTSVENQKKVVKDYKETTAKVITKLEEENKVRNNKDQWMNYVNQACDTIEEIDDELRTDCLSTAIVDISLDESRSSKTQYLHNSEEKSVSKNVTHDNEALSFSERISLTIALTDRLLALTRDRLDHISLLFKNKDRNILSRIASSKITSIYSIRQRLAMIAKIMLNLKYSIQCSYYSSGIPDSISVMDKLIIDADNMSKFSFKLEEWIHKLDLSIENVENIGYMDELPNNLLVKLDPIDTDSILFLSGERLHVTVAALAQYPCYDRLIKSSLSKIIGLHEPICPKKLRLDIKTPQSDSELTIEIHKLRRITAICALNIVDLHVIITRIDENYSSDLNKKASELKELLLFWRVVDKECHRLLRCNSLIQQVLVDTRRTYVELVSLTAVIISIIRTVSLSPSEITVLNQHLDNVHNYKLKLIEWLSEVELCSSVVHKKRITNRRFKFYEDIHNYLQENLHSVSSLAKNIKLGCHQTVESLTAILTYCSNLSVTSVTAIDSALCTNNSIDNRHLNMDNNCNSQISEGVLGAMVNLEIVESNVSRLQDLLNQSKELFLVITGDNQSYEIQENEDCGTNSVEPETNNFERDEQEIHILEKVTLDLTEKISSIATYAASNALLLFVDKSGIGKRNDVDTDQQISNWTSLSQNDQYLDEAVEQIVDDITAIMTASLFQNIIATENTELTMIPYKLLFDDICRQLRDRALDFLVENILLNRQENGNGVVSACACDLVEYFNEELSDLIIDDCVDTMSVAQHSSTNEPSIDACVAKLQRRLSQRLLNKTVCYIADFVGSFIDSSVDIGQETSSHVTEQLIDLPLPIATYRLWKKSNQELINPTEIFTKITTMIDTDLLSLKSYRCDIRKTGIWKHVQKNVSKPEIANTRIPGEKISKLIAQFNRVIIENEPKPRSGDAAIAIISTRSVQIKENEVVKELIDEIIEELPQFGNKGLENVDNGEYETMVELDDVIGSGTIVSIEPGFLNSTELYNSEVLQLCDVEKILPGNRKRKCFIGLCSDTVKRASLDDRCILSASENIPINLEIADLIQSTDSRSKLLTPVSVNNEETLPSEYVSSSISHYSPLLIRDASVPDTVVNCANTVDEDDLSLSSDYGFNDTNVTLTETNDSFTDTLSDVLSSAISDQRVLNSSEIVERFSRRDQAQTLQDAKYENRTDNLEHTVLNSPLEPSRTHNVEECTSTNTHNAIDNSDRHIAISCHRRSPPEDIVTTTMQSDYERSLSTLWLIVFAIILVVLLSVLCHDHVTRICRCLSSGRLLLPKIVSSGLPF